MDQEMNNGHLKNHFVNEFRWSFCLNNEQMFRAFEWITDKSIQNLKSPNSKYFAAVLNPNVAVPSLNDRDIGNSYRPTFHKRNYSKSDFQNVWISKMWG